jgi:hypothetical protein
MKINIPGIELFNGMPECFEMTHWKPFTFFSPCPLQKIVHFSVERSVKKKSGKDQSHYTKYYKLQFSRVIPSLKMSINVTFFVKFNVCCAPQHLHVVKIDVNNIKLYQGIRLMPYKTKT